MFPKAPSSWGDRGMCDKTHYMGRLLISRDKVQGGERLDYTLKFDNCLVKSVNQIANGSFLLGMPLKER